MSESAAPTDAAVRPSSRRMSAKAAEAPPADAADLAAIRSEFAKMTSEFAKVTADVAQLKAENARLRAAAEPRRPSALTLRSVEKVEAAAPPAAPAAEAAAEEDEEEGEGGWLGDYIKSIVFGGLDGIITSFAIVASVVGAELSIEVVIFTGFAKLFGDAISMGFGDCISEQAEQTAVRGERSREQWEYENYAEGEVREMVDIYKSKGFSEEKASRVIQIMTQRPEYKDFFIDHMMQQELGQQVPDESENPVKNGAVAFLSFVFWGAVPLIPYLIFYGADYHNTIGQFAICIIITVLCLFGLGAQQAIILKQSVPRQAALMALNGGTAAAASFLVSWGMNSAVGGGKC